ncbi:hypothetical protein EDC04DRAFT_2637860 [Pisolithus marmoratus]|nr:hypothetical protein EDC04DRAFT_2637860 [Pisolithus marmoratus]
MLDVNGPVEQWSGPQLTLEVTHSVEGVTECSRDADSEELTVRGVKDDDPPVEPVMADPSHLQTNHGHSDSVSVQSESAMHASATNLSQPSTTRSHLPQSAPAQSEAIVQAPPTALIARDRLHRHRSLNETRPSNRFSGFFSNLIHRRDNAQQSSTPIHPHQSLHHLRLPPPTLQELGLSLMAITATLSPSHFSTPPTNGTFLAPHYLLLCHAQGLDVLPLVSPPALQPYALVRRVPFKSVLVMEHRGVLVAIAGRRDGVRVYALEEVKRAIEWRIELEIRRERERTRREEIKKTGRDDSAPKRPHMGTPKKPRPPTSQPPSLRAAGQPPPYTSGRRQRSSLSLVVVPTVPPPVPTLGHVGSACVEAKSSDWQGVSDDEAIDMLTAGASGSEALDERTSSIPRRTENQNNDIIGSALSVRSHPIQSNQRSSLPNSSSIRLPLADAAVGDGARNGTPDAEVDEDDDDDTTSVPGERITLAQALLESRIPDLPPAGTLRPQEPILIANPPTTTSGDNESPCSNTRNIARRTDRRRRWSTLGGIFSGNGPQDAAHNLRVDGLPGLSAASPTPSVPQGGSMSLVHPLPHLRPSTAPTSISPRPSTSDGNRPSFVSNVAPLVPVPPSLPATSHHSRMFPRIFSNAFNARRTGERPATLTLKNLDADTRRNNTQNPVAPHAPPPKLEYVKLPGTKGALMIKAVETQKKSFLAILCGENGEKVELFAGTYRTALGLSRTFILPDSPKSLELQLQGDDLVEVFLMFSQNVFGLEPATVRVREVRIGRAERRAARRRVREIRSGHNDIFDTDPPVVEDEETNVNVNVSLSVQAQGSLGRSTSIAQLHNVAHASSGTAHEAALAHAEELVALASAQVGPYTTFQQLSFAPKFPLATVADDYIIPPTYADFLDYRAEHEPECRSGNADLASVQFNPPGLPMPIPVPPSRWFYRDPRGIVHGPWKATLMQAWYKDGLLPPDLPVRKEEDEEFILLKDLRQHCVDPAYPFRSAPPPPTAPASRPLADSSKPLLPPISLLVQSRHFGPPALFYSSRGGHSTSIVDARGRAVLKGRFCWSSDGTHGSRPCQQRMGDVKRLEIFDIKDRSIIVAMRQGGLEAMDFGDALFTPADESRSALPNFSPPPSNTNRRLPFVWRIGMPVTSGNTDVVISSAKTKSSHLNKKSSYSAGKSSGKNEFAGYGDGDPDVMEEILFLGRTGDDLYLCERNVGTFRIMRLCPESS